MQTICIRRLDDWATHSPWHYSRLESYCQPRYWKGCRGRTAQEDNKQTPASMETWETRSSAA